MRGRGTYAFLAVGVLMLGLLGCPDNRPPAKRILYVDEDNTSGLQNGLSWATAYADIQAAIAAADATYGGGEIWVAGGFYSMWNGDDPPLVVEMKSGVDLYGGFIGIGAGGYETSRDQRDWEANVTKIWGVENLKQTGAGSVVVVGADDAVLDGFLVHARPLLDSGITLPVCMLNDGVSPTVRNCTFEAVRAPGIGWEVAGTIGIVNNNCSVNIENCVFSKLGAGVRNVDSSGCVKDCVFDLAISEYGGGLYNVRSDITVENCAFTDNDCATQRTIAIGGSHDVCAPAIYNEACSPAVVDCTFSLNAATPDAGYQGIGGAVLNVHGAPSFLRCTFTGNSATTAGGAVCCAGPAKARFAGAFEPAHGLGAPDFTGVAGVTYGATFTNCAFTNNSATTGGAVCSMDGAACTFSGCTFTGNSSDYETF